MLRIICQEDDVVGAYVGFRPTSTYKTFELDAPETERWLRETMNPQHMNNRSIVGIEIVEVPDDNG